MFNVCHLPSFYQTEGIPDLIIEITTLFAERVIEEYIIACRSRKHHSHAYTVSTVFFDGCIDCAFCHTVFFDEFDGVGTVAERFRHLTPQLITHDTCEINVFERHLPYVFIASHDHAGNPEEDNVRTSNKVARGIIVVDFFIAGIVDAVKE